MKILVVDDENDVKTLFEQRFRKEIRSGEMEFMFACSGKDALTCLEKHTGESLLVLSDINMPGMSGLDLLKIIKEDCNLNSIPVIILTTSNAEADMTKAYDSHVNSYLVKPLDLTSFVDLITSLGYYCLVWNKKPY